MGRELVQAVRPFVSFMFGVWYLVQISESNSLSYPSNSKRTIIKPTNKLMFERPTTVGLERERKIFSEREREKMKN